MREAKSRPSATSIVQRSFFVISVSVNSSTTFEDFYCGIPLTDKSAIAYKVSDAVKEDPLWREFSQRKAFAAYACQNTRKLLNDSMTFLQKRMLQQEIMLGRAVPDEKECIPVLVLIWYEITPKLSGFEIYWFCYFDNYIQ